MINRLFALSLLFLGTPAIAVTCSDVTWSDASFTVCEVNASAEKLELFHSNSDGEAYAGFSEIVAEKGELSFAMNAGMFHADLSPVGLYQENGIVQRDIVLSAGPGNFGMLPNGVFCIGAGSVSVIESGKFKPDVCSDATQSGPMLVIDGELHPRFIDGGTSKFIRNGVGTDASQSKAYFVISNSPVNFYTFGSFFRDHLGLDQALYFDGNVSRLYAPQLNRNDIGRRLGPIVAVVKVQ